MRDAILFGTKLEPGRKTLHGMVARVAVPVGEIPDVVVHDGKLYVFHYEGAGELYYRRASTYHFQKTAVMVDGVEVNREVSNAVLHGDGRRGKP